MESLRRPWEEIGDRHGIRRGQKRTKRMRTDRNIRLAIAAAIAAMAVLACKKDEDEQEILPSLSGQLTFELTPFVERGVKVTVTPSGLKHPEGKGFGYYWKASFKEKNDTTRKVTDDPDVVKGDSTYLFPMTLDLGTYTISCTAFASGYYSSSATRSVTVVDQEKSLIDMGFSDDDPKFTDGRDGRTYRYVNIDGTDWMKQNLAYKGDENAPVGIPYENTEVMSGIFGRYYTWDEAKTVCPDGWDLPDSQDWINLANAIRDPEAEPFDDPDGIFYDISGAMMVDAKFNTKDNEMWEYWTDQPITNSSGLSMIPCGYADISYSGSQENGTLVKTGNFDSAYLYAAFWTGTENPDDGSQALFRFIYWDTPALQIGAADKEYFATPVRCVRKTE